MTGRTPPWFVRRLTTLLPQNCEALIGDLFEEYHAGRSSLWLCRQVVWAGLTRRSFSPTTRPGWTVASAQALSVDLAMWLLLAFEVVVAATLLDVLYRSLGGSWAATMTPQLPLTAAAAGLVMVCGAAGLLRACSGRGRLVSALCYSFGAMAAAWLTLLAAQPHQPRGFLPSSPMQLGTALVCVASLVGWSRLRRAAR